MMPRATETDIRYEEDPVMFMESELMYGDKMEIPEEEYYIEAG